MSVPSKRSLLAMDLEGMTVVELKDALRSLKLPLEGNKAELIEKLEHTARTMPESVFQYDDIKGLDPLIHWFKMTGRLFSPEAAIYGFTRFPAGVLLTGVPGCGKSMVAKAIANEWNMGFHRVHPDALVGPCVSDNEKFMRNLVIDLAAKAPVVCFMDEAEKLLGQTKAGTMYRAADAARDSAESILLQFMEDDNSGVFFIFTANEYEKMSPALLDRFHGRFFIDLPSSSARKDIISSMLEIRQRNPSDYDIVSLVGISDGCSGRDIRTAIDEAMKSAFFPDARPLVDSELGEAFAQAIPTSEIHKEQIAEMREMVSQGKMRCANSQELEAGALVVKGGGQIEWV